MISEIMYFFALMGLTIVQGCVNCIGSAGCMGYTSCRNGFFQNLPAASPFEAIAAAMAVPAPKSPPIVLPSPPSKILPGFGPPPSPIQVLQAPDVTIPGPVFPIIDLPTPAVPAPKVIAHKAVVSKAVLKPQVYQRIVCVPISARFMKSTVGSVVENIAYSANPKCGQLNSPCAILPPGAMPCACPGLTPCAGSVACEASPCAACVPSSAAVFSEPCGNSCSCNQC